MFSDAEKECLKMKKFYYEMPTETIVIPYNEREVEYITREEKSEKNTKERK